MDRDYEDEFILRGENGHIHLRILDAYGFPNETCHWGGYDTRSQIQIVCSNYQVTGEFYISTGELYHFYKSLKSRYEDLTGEAHLNSYENHLRMTISFDGMGHAAIKGSFRENPSEVTELTFELRTDQTFLGETISGLTDIYQKFGDNTGVTK